MNNKPVVSHDVIFFSRYFSPFIISSLGAENSFFAKFLRRGSEACSLQPSFLLPHFNFLSLSFGNNRLIINLLCSENSPPERWPGRHFLPICLNRRLRGLEGFRRLLGLFIVTFPPFLSPLSEPQIQEIADHGWIFSLFHCRFSPHCRNRRSSRF